MKIAVYSTKSYDRKYLELVNVKYNFDLEFLTLCSVSVLQKWRKVAKRSVFL